MSEKKVSVPFSIVDRILNTEVPLKIGKEGLFTEENFGFFQG